jgi:hypothetical protein
VVELALNPSDPDSIDRVSRPYQVFILVAHDGKPTACSIPRHYCRHEEGLEEKGIWSVDAACYPLLSTLDADQSNKTRTRIPRSIITPTEVISYAREQDLSDKVTWLLS